jgi:hypothetical protein
MIFLSKMAPYICEIPFALEKQKKKKKKKKGKIDILLNELKKSYM